MGKGHMLHGMWMTHWARETITDLDQVLLAPGCANRAAFTGLIPADFETWRVRRKAIVLGSQALEVSHFASFSFGTFSWRTWENLGKAV